MAVCRIVRYAPPMTHRCNELSLVVGAIALLLCGSVACDDSTSADGGAVDSGGADVSRPDSGRLDARIVDGRSDDAAPAVDGGAGVDASGLDAAVADTGSLDAGVADTGADASLEGDVGVGDAAPADSTPPNPCLAAGGICLGDEIDCTAGGGSLRPAGDPGCVFDDGPGRCCAPPTAAASGSTCENHGGLCAPISGCNFVDGAFAPATPYCSNVFNICCLPGDICGPETVICCANSGRATYRPTCDRGTFGCAHIPNTTLAPIGNCP